METKFFDNDCFLYGASTAPYGKSTDWSMEEWENDLITMKSLNFSLARIFIAWDRIEMREGQYDWSKPDYFLELAQKHQMKVLLNVGGMFTSLQGLYPPRYLKKMNYYPRQMDANVPTYNDGPFFTVCMDNEDYRTRALAFIVKAVKRYSGHPAVYGWTSWNEPSGRFCYCPATVARFRKYMEKKYNGDIAELNRAWGTEFPVDYSSFDEITPPATSGFIGGLNPMVDWFDFTSENQMDHMSESFKVIRQNDPNQLPITGNLCFGQAAEAITIRLVPERMRECFDFGGFSYYTTCEHVEGPTNRDVFQVAVRLEANRWVSGDPLKRTVILETEAGPNKEMITIKRRRFNNLIAVAHNTKAILLWNYRTRVSDNQVCNFHLMGFNGEVTERARFHADLAAALSRYGKLLNNAAPVLGKAAVMYDNRVRRGAAISKSNDWKEYTWQGALKMLWDINVPMDGWLPAHGRLDPEKCRILLIPAAEFMDESLAADIRDYVERGGVVVAETPFALKDLHNILHHDLPNYGLDEVFGVRIHDREGLETAPSILYPEGKAPVYFYWSRLDCTTAKPLLRYDDGSVFMAENRFGKGRAIIAGTEIFSQYMENPQAPAAKYLQELILQSGAERNAVLRKADGSEFRDSHIEVSHLSGPYGEAAFLANYSKTDAVTFKVELTFGNAGWTHIETGLPFDLDGEITMAPLDVIPLVRS